MGPDDTTFSVYGGAMWFDGVNPQDHMPSYFSTNTTMLGFFHRTPTPEYAGGASNVTGFHFTSMGILKAIPHSTSFLSTANSGAASLAFSPDGTTLLLTEKITGNIDAFNPKSRKSKNMADRAQNLQDTFLNHVRKNKTPLTIFLVNGVKLQGIVTWFDNFCVLLRRDGHSQLVYKHAISTIMPGAPLQLFEPAEEGAGKEAE